MNREPTYREDKRATGLKAAVFYTHTHTHTHTHLNLAEQDLDNRTIFDKSQREQNPFGIFCAQF